MSLLGKNIVIDVGEPWDYAGPDGTNRIPARIVEIGWDSLVAETPFEIDVPAKKVRGRRLVIKPRYVGGKLRDIAVGKCLVAGIAVIPPGKTKHAARGACQARRLICVAASSRNGVGFHLNTYKEYA